MPYETDRDGAGLAPAVRHPGQAQPWRKPGHHQRQYGHPGVAHYQRNQGNHQAERTSRRRRQTGETVIVADAFRVVVCGSRRARRIQHALSLPGHAGYKPLGRCITGPLARGRGCRLGMLRMPTQFGLANFAVSVRQPHRIHHAQDGAQDHRYRARGHVFGRQREQAHDHGDHGDRRPGQAGSVGAIGNRLAGMPAEGTCVIDGVALVVIQLHSS